MIQIGATPAGLESPIEHLVACHRRIEQRLDTLVKAADHLEFANSEDEKDRARAAISNSFAFLETSGALHTEDEEASLFPRLREIASSQEIAFMNGLEAQHAEADGLYRALKTSAVTLASSPEIERYRECAKALRDFYRAHIRTEDEILTVLATRLLSAAALGEISREMRERRASRTPVAVS